MPFGFEDLHDDPYAQWWLALGPRVERCQGLFPREQQGTIQFRADNGTDDLFYLELQSGIAKPGLGSAGTPTTWATIHRERLQVALAGGEPSGPVVSVKGDCELYRSAFAALAAQGESLFTLRKGQTHG